MGDFKKETEHLLQITKTEVIDNKSALPFVLGKYKDILLKMREFLNEHFSAIEQQDYRITREKWSLEGPYWSLSDIQYDFKEFQAKIMKAEKNQVEKIEMIMKVNSNLTTIREWMVKENDQWLAEKHTEGHVEAMIALLNEICNLPLACCEKEFFEANLSKANFKVIETLKKKEEGALKSPDTLKKTVKEAVLKKTVDEAVLKKTVESKLSRLRKKCYLAINAGNCAKASDVATVYKREVMKYLRRFKNTNSECGKWKNKIKITMDSVKEKECHENTGVEGFEKEDERGR